MLIANKSNVKMSFGDLLLTPNLEDRYRALLEKSPFSIQIFSPEGRTIQVNKAWEKLWGATLEQISGYNILEDEQLVKKGIMPYIRRAFAGETAEIPPILYDPEETIPGVTENSELQRWTRAIIYPVKDERGKILEVILIHEDITAQMLAEEKLRSSESRYRSLFETTPDGVLIVNEEGIYIDVNESYCHILKTSRENLIGSHFSLHMVPERLEEAKKGFADLKEKGYFEGDFPMRATDGSVIELEWWSRANFTPGLHVCVARDVTERRIAEEALRESEARYRSLLENANDIIYSHDLQGNYLSINRAGERITGYAQTEVLGGMSFAQVVVPEHLERAKGMIARKLENPEPTVYEVDIFAKNGQRLTLEVSTRISYRNGEPVAVEGIARDVTERKRIEQEKQRLARQVENQKKRLQAMVSNVPGIVWEAFGEPDEENQRIDFINDYVETMLGYTVEEWLSTPNFWLTIVHPDDREEAGRKAFETFKSSKPGINQFRWVTKDGKVIWVETQSVTIFDESGNPIGMRGVTMDISRRKQKEIHERFLAEASTALASSLDLKTMLENVAQLAVPDFADWCSVDLVNENASLERLAIAHIDSEKIARAHEVYRRVPLYPFEPLGLYSVLQTGVSEFYAEIPDEFLVQGARDEKHLQVLREIGFRSMMTVPLKLRDKVLGVINFVNTDSRHYTAEDLALAEEIARRTALAVDNAKLFRAEQQTRLAAERSSDFLRRLQVVSSSLSQALTPADVATAVIEQGINSLGAYAGTVVLFDESRSELEVVETAGFPKEIVDRWRRFKLSRNVPLADAIRDKSPVITESLDNYKQKYPELSLLSSETNSQALTAYPLVVEGRTIGAMGLSFPQRQNFTEEDRAFLLALAHQCAQALQRARLYENEQQLRAQAEQANRMKDEFLATVSHELRTPLNAIVGWSNMLAANRLPPDIAARALETIERNAKAQSQIIEDLLDVSRIITGKLNLNPGLVELESIVKTTLQSLQPAAETKYIRIESKFDSEANVIWGDADRLQQIMWNLLSNAIKFTPEGGKVEVSLERVKSFAEITVKDTGEGISAEFLPYVFDRFSQADSTTSRKFGGLGLGLAIVRHLVEMHGGTVKAESPGAGKGTAFTVTLPIKAKESIYAEDSEQNSSSTSIPDKTGSSSSYNDLDNVRILVVDDDQDARLLLATILENSGATVFPAASAAEALEAFTNFQPQILISDIGMPEEDGYSLIRRLRDLDGGKIPAIALSAYAREEDRIKAETAGFERHVAKPVEPIELIEIVKKLKAAFE